MNHTLPKLNYAYDALEPSIDAQTMEIHYEKHHGGYVSKLVAALEKHPNLSDKSLNELLSDLNQIPEDIRTAVRNNGGGHFNHTLFWQVMGPKGSGNPVGQVADAIKSTFGSFDTFKNDFSNAAATRFGSGWAWLVLDAENNLSVISTPNQDNPVMQGLKPVMGLDVWEHAYYLKYQNRRPDYISNWWDVLNWDFINQNYENLIK